MAVSKHVLSSKTILERVARQLKNLESEMTRIQKLDNKIEAIIQLFKVISPIQDAGAFMTDIEVLSNRAGFFKDYREEVEILRNLQLCIHTAGRSPHGMNRTQPGEAVTADKVYLGDVCGMFTHPATYWLKNRANLEASFRADVSTNPDNPVSQWYIIHDYQCRVFVDENIKSILKNIARFQERMAKR